MTPGFIGDNRTTLAYVMMAFLLWTYSGFARGDYVPVIAALSTAAMAVCGLLVDWTRRL